MIIHYGNAKPCLQETCRSEKLLYLDLTVLGAVGHICIVVAESQDSTEELNKTIYRPGSYSI